MEKSLFIQGFTVFFIVLTIPKPTFEQQILPNEMAVFGHCVTPFQEWALCIAVEDCKFLYYIIVTAFEQLRDSDRLYIRRSQCGHHNGKPLVCCPKRYRLVAQPTTAQLSKLPTNDKSLLPEPGVCGHVLTNRVYGGNKTKIDEYPWMVLIEYTKANNVKDHHCGGSLINTRYVITAAHCVNGRKIPANSRLTAVRLGEWDTMTNPDCEVDVRGEKDCAPEHLDIGIEEVIPHPEYNPSSSNNANDIALLRLERDISYTDFIKPICLPINEDLRTAKFDGISMNIAGWGKTENNSISNVKLKATINGRNIEECRSIYRRLDIILNDTQICAGGDEGVDSCRGDSGGPLISLDLTNDIHASYFLAGIVSFGSNPCGTNGWPGVYTRVGSYMDWILKNISP